MNDLPLGRDSEYPETLSPEVLHPIPRAQGRSAFGLERPLPFHGSDLWTAYELSWLERGGRPTVAVARFEVPADSPNLVESKSIKLYLGSFAMTEFASADQVSARIAADLATAAGAPVRVALTTAAQSTAATIGALPGRCIDYAECDIARYEVDPGLLRASGETVSEQLHSHLLRSLCPVTDQPDTGSVLIEYTGPRIDPASLLAYVVSFRSHNDFHELCVERMFLDITERCGARELSVYALYNRRGGIDINPFRSSANERPPPLRLWRQ